MSHSNHHEAHLLSEKETYDKTLFGFWIYIMTDCILFATLFATYVVLQKNVNGGPSGKELFSLPFVLSETLILLTSSFTCGLALIASQKKKRARVIFWLTATFLLGALFLGFEATEFSNLIEEGHSWKESAFLSAFFTLVGTHGLHISCGLLWIAVMIYQVSTRSISANVLRRLACFSLFWHFLDVVWIFIFTVVYLMGVA